MPIIVQLFFLLGTLWFAIQLFGKTALGWTIAAFVGLWALYQIARLAVAIYQRWDTFFDRFALSFGYGLVYAIPGAIASVFLVLIVAGTGWIPALTVALSTSGYGATVDAIMYGWFGVLFVASFARHWAWAGRLQTADRAAGATTLQGNQPAERATTIANPNEPAAMKRGFSFISR